MQRANITDGAQVRPLLASNGDKCQGTLTRLGNLRLAKTPTP